MDTGRRLARGSIAAAFSTWVALAFHVLGGGAVPAVAGLLIPFVLSWCACVRLAGWRTDALRLTASVVVSQALFHLLFAVGASGQVVGGHHGAGAELGAANISGAAPSSQMWLAHVMAAVVTVLALRSGEQAVSRLTRAVLDVARRLCAAPSFAPLVIGAGPSLIMRPAVTVRDDLGRFHRDISRRGPPVGAHPH